MLIVVVDVISMAYDGMAYMSYARVIMQSIA